MLSQLADKVLPLPIKQRLLACCPTMDLIAVALQDGETQVFRLNGQKVFGLARREQDGDVVALCWKPNGRVLAVAYSKGNVLQLSPHTGQVIFQKSHSQDSPINYLSWDSNFTDARAARSMLEGNKGKDRSSKKGQHDSESLLHDALAKGLRELHIELPLDLPTDLGSLEIESSLPKLSTLPAGGGDDDVFSARNSLDALFHAPKKDSSDSVDVLIVGFENGSIHLDIYDSFTIGRFEGLMAEKGQKVVRHCSHPYTSTHACLVAYQDAGSVSMSLLPMDLKMIPDMGRYLPLLASKSTQLKNLLRYMRQTVTQICTDFRTSQELPKKFMRIVNEELEEKEYSNLPTSIFHLAATGQCSPVLNEWLTDQLGERGYRRWEKAASSGYEGVCRYTLQNLIPALDRFAVILSRFKGLSRFYDTNSVHGLDTAELESVFDTLGCLRLVAHTVLRIAGTELRNFTAFAKWIKLEIEVQATDPMSASVDEFPASFSTLEYPPILEFIQGEMQKSRLEPLCGEEPVQKWLQSRSELIYDDVKKLLAVKSKADQVPSLGSLMSRLEWLAGGIFAGIANAQKRKVMFGKFLAFDEEDVGPYDITMSFDEFHSSSSTCDVHFAVASASEPKITVYKVRLDVMNGMSSTQSSEVARVLLPPGLRVQDLKFADGQNLIAVLMPSQRSQPALLVYLPYRGEDVPLMYHDTAGKTPSAGPLDWADGKALDAYVRHRFDEAQEWVPDRLEVNGRKDRRVLCIMERDGRRYKVFDLDSAAGDGEDDENVEEGVQGEEMELE